ncbi:MAG: peptidase MA family metallohydrolase [Nitrospiraceae bacterium]
MKTTLCGILCLGLSLSVSEVYTAEPVTLHIEAPEPLAPLVARLNRADPAMFGSAMRLTGLVDPGATIRVMLAEGGSPLARQVPPWVSGYALGPQGMIVLIPSRVMSYPHTSLEALLTHEVAHILVARAANQQPVPRWFDEGLAMAAAHRWGLEDRGRFIWAMASRTQVSFDELNGLFRQDEASVQRAYVLAGAVVRDLIHTAGQDAPGAILDLMSKGVSFSDAFTRVTAMSIGDAERVFWRQQTMWSRWVPVLTSTAMLWLGITLLAVYAYRRRRKRALAIQQQWDEEDSPP